MTDDASVVEAVARLRLRQDYQGAEQAYEDEYWPEWRDEAREIIAALTALREKDGWRPIGEAPRDGGEMLGWAPGCGYEVIRLHSDGFAYAGAFNADWVKWVRPLPAAPVVGEGKTNGIDEKA